MKGRTGSGRNYCFALRPDAVHFVGLQAAGFDSLTIVFLDVQGEEADCQAAVVVEVIAYSATRLSLMICSLRCICCWRI